MQTGSSNEPDARESASRGQRTVRLDITFDGAAFAGWQKQPDARSVQGEIEAGLAKLLQTPHGVVGSGRTDAGVHARHLVVSFRTTHTMSTRDLARGLDAVVPRDVGVLRATDVDASFHAQRSAAWKWYRYRVLLSRRKRPLRRGSTWRVPVAPDTRQVAAAAGAVRGVHDFASFANAGGSPGTSTVRRMHHARVTPVEDELHFDIVGEGFLYKMVRTWVGTSLQLASEQDPAAAMHEVLSACDRAAAGRAAPAEGLTLMAVCMADEGPFLDVPSSLRPQVD